MASSNSRWIKKTYKIVDSLVHNYPKLPDFPLGISVKEYNTFLDRNEATGYKLYWKNQNVFIVEMSNREHEAIASYLQDCFKEPNNRVKIDPPIEVFYQPYHFNPTGHGNKIASEVAVCPSEEHVPRPLIPHPGPPPSDVNMRNHARVVCEIANAQTIAEWEKRCENWIHEKYVRCVFGIKLGKKISHQDQVHRPMIAKLWMRQALEGSVLSTNQTLRVVGVHIKTWDFGTIKYGTLEPTGCIEANLPAYQVAIPVSEIFWDPPITNGVINEEDHNPTVPDSVVGKNFLIDLYSIQRWVFKTQT